jgi:chloride channel 7
MSNAAAASFLFYVAFSITCAGLAAAMTVYIAPTAAGSGIPELMSMMNGVDFTNQFSSKLLLVKALGVVLVVVGSLCVGKEGPLAHIGAIIAVSVLFAPLDCMRQFQTDTRRREFIAAGVSAGVSVAFGAPIGATFFAYEISSPNTFWTFKLLWRNFFCAAISTFTLSILTALKDGSPITLSDSAILKFGIVPQDPSPFIELPGAIIIGLVCGLLGAIFVHVNT